MLQGCTELQLFYAAKIWLESDLTNRLQHAAALMQNIRFPLINPTDLITHVQVSKISTIKNSDTQKLNAVN